MTPLPLEASPREQQFAMALLAHAARGDNAAIAALLAMTSEPDGSLNLQSIITAIFDEYGCVMPVLSEPFDTSDSLSIITMILDEFRWTMRHNGDEVAERLVDRTRALAAAQMTLGEGG